MLIWEGDIKIDVGEMCCIEEVFQTAVVGHLNLNNILKLGESNCSTHLLELVKFHTGHISWYFKFFILLQTCKLILCVY